MTPKLLTAEDVDHLFSKWERNFRVGDVPALVKDFERCLNTLSAALKVVKVQKKIMRQWYHGNPLGEDLWKEAREALTPFYPEQK